MKFVDYALIASMSLLADVSTAQNQIRVERQPPTPLEQERIASEIIMNDSLLQKGDIIVTDRGFFVFQGLAADGYTFNFNQVPSPIGSPKK